MPTDLPTTKKAQQAALLPTEEGVMAKKDVQDTVAKLCSTLAELGCEYHFEADNRRSRHSHYVYVRRPKYIEIRVSDHPANKIRRRQTFDIGPHAMSLEQAVKGITELVKS